MDKKTILLLKIKALERQEKTRRRRQRLDTPYKESSMDVERMPLGCWLWILGLMGAVFYVLTRFR